MEVIDYGDSGILVRFSNEFSDRNWRKTHLFSNEFRNKNIDGILSVIPTLTTVFIHFDLLVTKRLHIKEVIDALLKELDVEEDKLPSKTYRIPIAFGNEYGPDLQAVLEELNMSKRDFIHDFTSKELPILCISRGPMLSSPLDGKVSRRESPRESIPAGTLNIAYNQVGISWVKAPSGWKSIGRTPIELFNSAIEKPSLLKAGDTLKFFPVDSDEFEKYQSYDVDKLEVGDK